MGVALRRFAIAAAVVLVAGVAASAGSASRARTYATPWTPPLQTSIDDPFTLTGSQAALGFQKTRAAGASYVGIMAPWSEIAPSAPPAGTAADPDSPAYSWAWLDQTVASAEAAGLTPILDIDRAPAWALAIPAKAPNSGTPSVAALRKFATALALRYDGKHGEPAVHDFMVWNEPNLSLDLSPVSPAVYRSMVNAVAGSAHAVSKTNLVVAGSLDPFSNKTTTWHSEAPLTFMRALLCVSGGKHPHRTCKSQIHFDVWAHHPYTFGGPFAKAKRANDVSLGNLTEMRAVLTVARRLHRIVSAKAPPFWVTEFAWGTSPPRATAAPVALAARWTSESLYQMWRSGVTLATWFVLQDQPEPSAYICGLYFRASSLAHARAKPVRTAFRFPFVAYLGRGTVRVWGRTATSTKKLVTIRRRTGLRGHWRTVARIEPNRYGIFRATLRLAATKRDWLRASASGSGNSLAFSLTVPKAKRKYGPWGSPK